MYRDGVKSAQLIYSSSSTAFVDALLEECMDHPAVRHPYLDRLANGSYPDHHFAVKDYAQQYGYYSAKFTQALRGILDRLDSDIERATIEENLVEEEGDPTSTSLELLPHRELFRRFAVQVGAADIGGVFSEGCLTVRIWTHLFLEKCVSDPVEIGIGAIGLGTESIVPLIYPKLLQAVDRLEVANPEEARIFFALHVGADEDHGTAFARIASNHAASEDGREALRFGAISSLNLRHAFYDVMDARASEGHGLVT